MGRGEVGLGVHAEDGMLEIVVHTGDWRFVVRLRLAHWISGTW
jgi:hypothetical protein